jgi:hypothetical protein
MGLLSKQALAILTTPQKKGDVNHRKHIDDLWDKQIEKDVSAAAYALHREYLRREFQLTRKAIEGLNKNIELLIKLQLQKKSSPIKKLTTWIKEQTGREK